MDVSSRIDQKSPLILRTNKVSWHQQIIPTIALLLVTQVSCVSNLGYAEGLRKAGTETAHSEKTKMYHGAWFNVRYPADFHARPGQPAVPGERGPDSAFFTSPNWNVEFYVYSPLWRGTPDYTSLASGETWLAFVDKIAQFKGSSDQLELPAGATVSRGDTIRVRWATVRNKKGGYCRSWEDWENTSLNIGFTFGIKYRDSKSLARVRPAYLAFKSSLEQFSD